MAKEFNRKIIYLKNLAEKSQNGDDMAFMEIIKYFPSIYKRSSAQLLREFSELVAFLVMQIINASYREQNLQKLPSIWKMANVPPLPKLKVVTDLTKDLRPISLTTYISKVAEDFVVVDYMKPAILKVVGSNQYGVVPKSSTTQALIDMIYHWSIGTDGNGSTIRSVFFIIIKHSTTLITK